MVKKYFFFLMIVLMSMRFIHAKPIKPHFENGYIKLANKVGFNGCFKLTPISPSLNVGVVSYNYGRLLGSKKEIGHKIGNMIIPSQGVRIPYGWVNWLHNFHYRIYCQQKTTSKTWELVDCKNVLYISDIQQPRFLSDVCKYNSSETRSTLRMSAFIPDLSPSLTEAEIKESLQSTEEKTITIYAP